MALAFTYLRKTVPGGRYFATLNMVGDTSYVTGGSPIDPTKLGLPAGQLKGIIDIRPANLAATAFQPILVETVVGGIDTVLLQFAVIATQAQVAAATNMNPTQWTVIVEGN